MSTQEFPPCRQGIPVECGTPLLDKDGVFAGQKTSDVGDVGAVDFGVPSSRRKPFRLLRVRQAVTLSAVLMTSSRRANPAPGTRQADAIHFFDFLPVIRFASRSIPGGRPETWLPPPEPRKEDGSLSDLKEISAGAAGADREGRSPNMGMQAQTMAPILIFGWHGEPLASLRAWVARG